jgi:dolichol-phosphate mannosyltransferase
MKYKNKFLIIIPVYNERNNIAPIVKKILVKFKKKLSILFIDDNSTDGTTQQIYKLQSKYKNIFLIRRNSKLGIGSAHKCGLKWGYKKRYFIIITMDCDGTHDPSYLNKLIKPMQKSEIVITNRFIKKNALQDWSIWRIFLTKFRHNLIKFLLNIRYDSSGAFRCYDTTKVKLKDILQAKDNGYSFFWESIFILHKKKYNISEISINLPGRLTGSSKMRIKDIFYSLIYLLYISVKKIR